MTDKTAWFSTSRAAATFGGIISGFGSLTQAGTGILTLAGNNTYAGGTTISAGTLQVGSGTAGSIVGNVLDNANLVFNRADNPTFGGVISGSGSLTQTGTGVLTLAGSNTYSGSTTISAGTLQIGNGGSGASIGSTSSVLDNASLVFNHGDSVTFSPAHQRQRQPDADGHGHSDLAGQQHLHAAARRSRPDACRSATAAAAPSIWQPRA